MIASSISPLVEPIAALEPERWERFSRQVILPGFGETAQRRLENARVLLVGAGGLGSATAPYLAATGVGCLGIVDADRVELSNLHRQIMHGVDDIGRFKVDSLADSLARIDPAVRVVRHPFEATEKTLPNLLHDYDVIVDGSDNFATRYLVNDAAVAAKKPLVWGAVLGYHGQAGVAWVTHGPHYRDLFPHPPTAETASCEYGGVLPGVCAAIGAVLSTEVVKLITGIGDPLIGRVLTVDLLNSRYRDVPYSSERAALKQKTEPIRPNIDTAEVCIDPAKLAQQIAAGTQLQLIDVREPAETAISRISGAELMPLPTIIESVSRVRRDIPVILYCRSDPRSRQAAKILRENGRHNVSYLVGGIEAFSRLDKTGTADND